MKINRAELLKGLESIFPILVKNLVIDTTVDFLFSKKEIIAYNSQISAFYPFKTDFSFSVPAEEFYKIISKTSSEIIEIFMEDNKLKIKDKGIEASIICNQDTSLLDNIPFLEISEAKRKAEKLPENFIKALEFCIFSASKDRQLEALQCLLVENENIISADSYRVSRYKIDAKFKSSFLLPVLSAIELIKFDINKYFISKGKNKIYFFTDGNISFCSQLIIDDFPSCLSSFDGFNKDTISIPKDIEKAISIAEILASGSSRIDKEIKITIFKERWECQGENDFGWIKKDINFISKNIKKEIKFSINPLFLRDIISKVKLMVYSDDKTRLLFKNDDFEHVLALRTD